MEGEAMISVIHALLLASVNRRIATLEHEERQILAQLESYPAQYEYWISQATSTAADDPISCDAFENAESVLNDMHRLEHVELVVVRELIKQYRPDQHMLERVLGVRQPVMV